MTPGPVVVAVDLGGTLTKIGLATAGGELLDLEQIETRFEPAAAGGQPAVAPEWLADVVSAKAESVDARGFGVAVPGIVADGIVHAATNIGWYDVPLASIIADRTGLPGRVGHDVRAGGLAEWRLGSGAGVDNFVFLPLGTGIAGAIVVDDRMLVADGYAGEVGHIRVTAGGDLRCGCGQTGCLELVSSATGVRRTYARLAGTPLDAAPTAKIVARLARDGEPLAMAAVDLAASGLAEAVPLIAGLFGPERICFGGGLAASFDLLEPQLRAAVDRLTFHRRPELVVAELGPQAGLVGAGLLGWEGARAAPALVVSEGAE